MARVLIVDDEESIRFTFKEHLLRQEHEVHLAGSVEEAARVMAAHEIDVVVSDIIMPGLNGTELMARIREESNGVQVILITGEPTVDTASMAVRSGAFDYLCKPVGGSVLQRVVANAARVKALQEEKTRLERENQAYQEHLEMLVEKRTSALSEALLGVINAMSAAVEKRDPYTAGHQLRVAHLAREMAREMDLPLQKIEGAYLASLIHDLGKISVPAELLSKPTELLEEEFALIKKHPRTGYDILSPIRFQWPLPEIVLQHHERWDGSGYPQGLKGEEILIEARIIAVADTIESMASHRPYRPGIGLDAALDEITRHSGVLYDPVVVRACLDLLRHKGYKLQATG